MTDLRELMLLAAALSSSGDKLHFTPVPRKRVRYNGWTVQRQKDFIAALAASGCVAQACAHVSMSKASAYGLRAKDGAESFAAAWDRAVLIGTGQADIPASAPPSVSPAGTHTPSQEQLAELLSSDTRAALEQFRNSLLGDMLRAALDDLPPKD